MNDVLIASVLSQTDFSLMNILFFPKEKMV